MAEIWTLAALWLGLVLIATLLSIWLLIATALSEIVVGTVTIERQGQKVSDPEGVGKADCRARLGCELRSLGSMFRRRFVLVPPRGRSHLSRAGLSRILPLLNRVRRKAADTPSRPAAKAQDSRRYPRPGCRVSIPATIS